MSDATLGDTRVRAALADASKWSRTLAIIGLASLALVGLMLLGVALAMASGSLPIDLTEIFAEGLEQAGYGTLPASILLGATALYFAVNAYVMYKLLAFGRRLRGRRTGLPDAAVGTAFGDDLTAVFKASVVYQLGSAVFSLAVIAYTLLASG